ncbi:glycosyltransferase [Candidatus Woesearchaeota archaeon]|nr:glycosyltransferase [Candidatus Woesearchaeota archaeon]MBW3014664.1 glycosyltransferase [Candidatus Woesearchaeota archaeon]
MNVLFGICTWGLGHATRDLPLIKALLQKKHSVTIATSGRSLEFLKKEVPECHFIDFPDYPLPYTKKAMFFPIKFTGYLPKMFRAVRKERRNFRQLLHSDKYDLVVSDCRYGLSSKRVPCYFMTHQLRFIAPKRIRFAENSMELMTYAFSREFDKVLVPDYKGFNMTGDLSHNMKFFDDYDMEYLGILSSMERMKVDQDIDYFISISGPEPQRTVFQKKVLKQAKDLDGNVVITLGKPELEFTKRKDNVVVHSCLNVNQQQEMMNRAKLVISRSGYTTMMDLVHLGKKALYIPTLGQTEQVYLSDYHNRLGTYYSVSQGKMNLKKDVQIAKRYPGFKQQDCRESVKRFLKVIKK